MTIRRATAADRDVLRTLWRRLEDELGGPPFLRETWEEEWEGWEEELVFLAEEEGESVGYVRAEVEIESTAFGWVQEIYVVPEARGRGVGRRLLTEAAAALRERGVRDVGLEVLETNREARRLYERLGFVEYSSSLAVPLDELERRLGGVEAPPSFGSLHVQTDSVEEVVQAVRQYVPRLPGGSRGSVVAPPRNGWTAVYDELCDREPRLLRRLARELSDRLGAVVLLLELEEAAVVRFVLFERGRVMDEYASLPEHSSSLPPGEVVALAANPTVVARLTGADPREVRAVARQARRADELLPPLELLAALAAAQRVDGSLRRALGPRADDAASTRARALRQARRRRPSPRR